MEHFKLQQLIAEGQYGSVFRAQDIRTGEVVAIKRLKEPCSYEQGISLREVVALRKLSHPNLVTLKSVFEHELHFHMVFEYGDCTLVQLYKVNPSEGRIRSLVYQLLEALHYMHSQGYFHRDLKPENILVFDKQVKICDFGLAREIKSLPPYTEYVATRWYRAPEILQCKPYNYQVDIFALGLIMAELYLRKPLAAGNSQKEQYQRLEKILVQDFKGLEIAGASGQAMDLMYAMLKWEPSRRPSASELMEHSFFRESDQCSPTPMIARKRNNSQIRSNPFKIVKNQESDGNNNMLSKQRRELCEQKEQQQQQQQRLPAIMRRFRY